MPSNLYYATFTSLYDGDYRSALDAFRGELRGGVKVGQLRWIDSICYFTMTGEAYYRMGQFADALDCYNAALALYVANAQWPHRVQFTPTVAEGQPLSTISWGASRSGVKPGRFPPTYLMSMGRLDNDQVVKQGGIVQKASLNPVGAIEIMRCTTLAMYRRRQLMGPVAPFDTLTTQLVATLVRRPGPPNHWVDGLITVQLGMAYAGAGKPGQAVPLLTQGLVVAGQYDHPLASLARLQLGHFALEAGDASAALNHFEEATYSAAQYGNYGELEEAFRMGALAHTLAGRKGMHPLLGKALAWGRPKNRLGRQVFTSMLLAAADNFASEGNFRDAQTLIKEAKTTVGRSDMGQFDIGAQLNYLTGVVQYQSNSPAAGDRSIAAALEYQKKASKWLFQIALTDSLFVKGTFTSREVTVLFQYLLRDPLPSDWARDPLEALSVMAIPHPLPFEHWFDAAMSRKELDSALEISDRARRHRFYSTQALGGRLMALRWILEAPPTALGERAQLQKQDLLARYPLYKAASQQAQAIKATIAKSPLAPTTPEAQREQATLIGQLSKVSATQEAMLREIAVRREGADLAFPPMRSMKEIKESLPKGTLLLTFFTTGQGMHAFLMSNERYANWTLSSTGPLEKQSVALLRAIGNYDANRELTVANLRDQSWKNAAKDLLDAILAGSKVNLAEGIDELIIVPDSYLWYVPFEALQVNDGGVMRSLISKTRVRYAPTLGLTVPDRQGRVPSAAVAVTTGKLFPRDDASVSVASFETLKRAVPGAVALKGPSVVPSPLLGSLFDGLIALDDINAVDHGVFDWSPMPLDRTAATGSLNNWLALPWGGPDTVVLPGFHTAAESGMKKVPPIPGNEIFLSLCGLMSTGTRTILISRWRTGGQHSVELVRDFVQELPFMSAAGAWQRAVQLGIDTPLNLASEPRIKVDATADGVLADHPFLWSGYLLVDTGRQPAKPDAPAPAAPVVLKLDPKAAPNGAAPNPAPNAAPANPAGPAGAQPVAANPVAPKPAPPDLPLLGPPPAARDGIPQLPPLNPPMPQQR